ncbi:MAG: hypothetical protein KatS3mg102_0079 [Planctomycetota bacterium]|nr:MAG: hypothetical protein KatS3mg102_0079 [Planctomycetota bacterium]
MSERARNETSAAETGHAAPGVGGTPAGAGAEPPRGTPFGPYLLVAELGRGAMGVVYRGYHRELGRPCAIKTINPQLLDEEAVQRFVREGRATARLGKHPNLVQVFDAGVIEGTPYIAMELVEGEPLDRLVARRGPLGEREVLEMARKIALALDHAHRRGIVHRDLKPGNVVIDREGEPQLLDFGLAKDVHSASLVSTAGAIIGTPAYMAPEQAQPGLAPVDRRADVYALGALIHHALTGKPPFAGDSMVATIVKVLTQDPPRLSQLVGASRDLEAIVERAMEKSPARRYQTALEMADDLSRVIAGEPPRARALSGPARLWRRVRRNRKALAAVGVLLLGFAGATGYLLYRLADAGRAILQRNRAAALLGNMYGNESAARRIEIFERAIALDPSWDRAYFQLAVAYLDRALELDPVDRVQGRELRRKAIEVLQRGIARGLGVVGYYQLANTYEELLDYPQATENLRRAVALDPEGLFGMRAACALALLEGRFRQAEAIGTRVLEIAPDDDLTYWRRGTARLALEDYAGAAADGEQAVKLWDIEPEYHLLAAEGWLGAGELAAAGRWVLEARQIHAEHPLLRVVLADRALRDGQAQRALALAELALAQQPREPRCHVARARARLAHDDLLGARSDLEAALALHAHEPHAVADLAALQDGAQALPPAEAGAAALAAAGGARLRAGRLRVGGAGGAARTRAGQCAPAGARAAGAGAARARERGRGAAAAGARARRRAPGATRAPRTGAVAAGRAAGGGGGGGARPRRCGTAAARAGGAGAAAAGSGRGRAGACGRGAGAACRPARGRSVAGACELPAGDPGHARRRGRRAARSVARSRPGARSGRDALKGGPRGQHAAFSSSHGADLRAKRRGASP